MPEEARLPDYSYLPDAQAALAYSQLPPRELAAVAFAQPVLWPVIPQHPSVYPELLDWMAQWAGPEAMAVIEPRRAAFAQALAAKQLRRAIGKLAGVVALAIVAMQLVIPLIVELGLMLGIPSLRAAVMGGAANLDEVMAAMAPWLGLVNMIAALGAASLYLILRGKRLVTTDITTTVPVGDRWGTLAKIAVLFFSVQMFLILLMALLSLTGYDPSKAQSEGINPILSSVAGIVYVGFVGPVVEEIVFRGAILRHLAPFGVNFAIVTQALLFGLYHMNLYQGIFAFVIGLLLGYVAINFSIKWAMLLHIANNCLGFAPARAEVPLMVVLALCAIGAIAIAIADRRRGRPLIEAGRSDVAHVFHIGWSHPGFIAVVTVLFAICTAMMFLVGG